MDTDALNSKPQAAGAFKGTDLPPHFPVQAYTPFGYIDNPYHSTVLNRSGIIRSVPPMGFGFWCRSLPWPYASTMTRQINYLSFLHLSADIDGMVLHSPEDFSENNIFLQSRYHTKTMMSYDWEARDISFSAKYFLADEHSLVCIIHVANTGNVKRNVTLHTTNIYGYPESRWWGSSGILSLCTEKPNTIISKLWEYGDVFVLGADRTCCSRKATPDEDEWRNWIYRHDTSSNDGASIQFSEHQQLYAVASYSLDIPGGSSEEVVLILSRDVNQPFAVQRHTAVRTAARSILLNQLEDDEHFYRQAPLLTGDWPDEWKQGWIYDYETLRMTVRPPAGIYKHPWDGMQIFMPRCVLGETHLDMLCMSYADIGLAKEVIYGTFADAPVPNIPCSREDGSMNMIDAGGAECGTSPVWGLPFHVIRSIYLRDRDDEWIRKLYPYLKSFIEWWLEHRTDDEGWFHCNNSWESGQDGSKRFTFDGCNEGDVVDFVRTVDVEAAMANAMKNMVFFAAIAGHDEDSRYWHDLAERRIATTREMYVDGWFRDVDARTHTPIILKDYYDIMMFLPVTLGIATPEQIEGMKHMFAYFREHPHHWLDWPSFMFPFTEAASNAGMQEFAAELIVETGNRIYTRTASRTLLPASTAKTTLPDTYNYRIPGVSPEFWPRDPDPRLLSGSECYGWGATLPSLVIRNIFGYKEDTAGSNCFIISPMIPDNLASRGKTFGIQNLRFNTVSFALNCTVCSGNGLQTEVIVNSTEPTNVSVTDSDGTECASCLVDGEASLMLEGENGRVYQVSVS
jgi:hypothetical protein